MRVIPECEKGKQFADNQRKDTKDNKGAAQDLTITAMGRQLIPRTVQHEF